MKIKETSDLTIAATLFAIGMVISVLLVVFYKEGYSRGIQDANKCENQIDTN